MLIGINLLQIIPGELGGIETYFNRTFDRLLNIDEENRYILFTNAENHEYYSRFSGSRVRTIRCISSARNKIKLLAYIYFYLPVSAGKMGIDLLFSPGNIAPPVPFLPSVVSILDAAYDSSIKPRAYDILQRLMYSISAVKATAVITISESAKQDITSYCHIKADKIRVIYLGPGADAGRTISEPETAQLRKQFGVKRYILSLGTMLWRKNYETLVEAFSGITDKETGLVIVGKEGPATKPLMRLIEQKNLQDRVKIAGYFRGNIEALYRGAELYVQPSKYEGFGLPVLEAMSLGVPVITSDASSLPEIGGDAVLYFNPFDQQALQTLIDKALSDINLRRQLVEKGKVQASKFSWDKCARAHLNVFRETLGRRHSTQNPSSF